MDRNEVLARLDFFMAGRVAENMIFGKDHVMKGLWNIHSTPPTPSPNTLTHSKVRRDHALRRLRGRELILYRPLEPSFCTKCLPVLCHHSTVNLFHYNNLTFEWKLVGWFPLKLINSKLEFPLDWFLSNYCVLERSAAYKKLTLPCQSTTPCLVNQPPHALSINHHPPSPINESTVITLF